MFDEARLKSSLEAAADMERASRHHIEVTRGQAAEQAMAHAVYRNAVALRKGLERWIETRAYRAQLAEKTT